MKPDDRKAQNQDRTLFGIEATDLLATFMGFFSLVLIIILTAIDLLSGPALGPSSDTSSQIDPWLDSTVFLVVVVLTLLASTRLNDLLISDGGKAGMVRTVLVVGLLSCALGMMGVPGPVVVGARALSISLSVLVWGAILSRVNSIVLAVVLMTSCLLVGIVVFLDSQPSAFLTYALVAVLHFVSWHSARHISTASLEQIAFATRSQSIERHVPGKGNSFALVLVGSMFGTTVVLAGNIGLAMREITLLMGTCLLISGGVISLFYRDLCSRFGNAARRMLALCMTMALVPFPFVGSTGQVICVGFLSCVGIINLVLIFDSILETSRFNQISPFWIIGLEGSVFFVGALAVLVCSAVLMPTLEYGLEVMAFVLVGASSILQIYINNQAYPIFQRADTSTQEATEGGLAEGDAASRGSTGESATQESAARGTAQKAAGGGAARETPQETPEDHTSYSAFWRSRVSGIAEEYQLTPRQKEIMELLIMGRDLNYITVRLSISRPTAKTHLSNLYRKMNIHSKQELIDLMEHKENLEDSQ